MRFILMLAALAACGSAIAGTYIVTRTDDDCDILQQCLRRSILLANATPETDTIIFNIPGDPAQPRRIVLASPLVVTQPVVIDGYTQPGASANTLEEGTNAQIRIVLDASGAGVGASALSVNAGPSDIRGLAFVGADHAGVSINSTAAEVNLRGSFVGVEPDGVTAAPNRWGVSVYGDFNVIGGTAPADRNMVSANRWSGVLLYGNRSIRNAVVGNLIGTDRHVAPVLGNGWDGVQITNARLSRIGGHSREMQNVIAGNVDGGVYLISNDTPGIEYVEVVSRIWGNNPLKAAVELGNCPLTNDPGDGDTGANGCLNSPAIARARAFNGELIVEGAFDSTPNVTARVALYGNTRACATFRGGETGQFIGYATVVPDAGGHSSFRFAVPFADAGFTSVAAIAGTGQEDVFVDGTSRVSPCVGVEYADRIFSSAFEG